MMGSTTWRGPATEPAADRHLVHIHRDPAFLRDVVATWADAALSRGGAVILLGTRAHADDALAHLRVLGHDVEALRGAGRIRFGDAHGLADRFLAEPERDFRARLATLIGEARAAAPSGEVRAWGEIVDLLRKRGAPDAALRLEALWNDVIDAEGVRLLCSYEADNLAPETHAGALREMCACHSLLIHEPDYARFERALERALVDVFGEEEAGLVRIACARRRPLPTSMPAAQAVLMALHETHPEAARRVLEATRARLA